MQYLQDNKRLSCDGDFDIYTWFEGDGVICLTMSEVAVRSIKRLWILSSYLSQVFEPSPFG